MILSSRRCRQLLALVLGARFARAQPGSQSTSRSALQCAEFARNTYRLAEPSLP